MKLHNKILLFSSSLLVLGFGACKKSYLDRLPSDLVPLDSVFTTTQGAEQALQGLHRSMYEALSEEQFGQKSIDLTSDLMGNDMALTDYGAGWFIGLYQYSDSRTPTGGGTYPWSFYFRLINNANQILEHIDAAKGPETDKNNIKGQAHFYRAFAYYNLSIFYQHTYAGPYKDAPCVPIYTRPTREGHARATVQQVYDFIIGDLDSATAFLQPFNGVRVNKSEINIDVVNGLYARVALVMQNWSVAASKAAAARQNYSYMSPDELLAGFNDWANPEWIWGSTLIEDQTNNTNSFLGEIDVDAGVYANLGQQKKVNKILFQTMDPNDIRKGWWYADADGIYQQFNQKKFRIRLKGSFATDVCYMRSAEMALIEAEAKANLNDLAGARQVLQDLVQTRQPDYDASTFTTQNALLNEILRQRRIELWGEGFRFADIQRAAALDYVSDNDKGLHREGTGAADAVMGSAKTFSDPYDNRFLFRIPSDEINQNPNMNGSDQNP